MTDAELIGYCRIHASTQRALFNEEQINRMLALANYPSGYVRQVETGWYSLHKRMTLLCDIAEARMQQEKSNG